MPIEYSFVENSTYDLHVHVRGAVQIADVVSIFRSVTEDERRSSTVTTFVELDQVDFRDVDYQSLSRFGRAVLADPGPRTIAAVFAVDPFSFGVARQYHIILGEPERLKVFQDREAAIAWLATAKQTGPSTG